MRQTTTDRPIIPVDQPVDSEVLAFRQEFESRSPLDAIVQEGARRMLQAAIDAEVESFLEAHQDRRDEQGRRLVVRNGSLPSRTILTGASSLEVNQGRVRDNSPDPESRLPFSPSVLPAYLRRTKAIEELIPWLYLKGVSTSDFSEALQALVGEPAKGLSANVVVRLKEQWAVEYGPFGKKCPTSYLNSSATQHLKKIPCMSSGRRGIDCSLRRASCCNSSLLFAWWLASS